MMHNGYEMSVIWEKASSWDKVPFHSIHKIAADLGIHLICGISEKEGNKNFHLIERGYGKFQRSFYLPNHVKADSIKANYKNGVLTVNIPKSEEAKPKEIAIS